MASTNGILSPGRHSDGTNPSFTVPAKRKWEGSDAEEEVNGTADSKYGKRPPRDPQQQISDLIEVLKRHDTKPSVLNRELPPHDVSAEPQTKRKKSDLTSGFPTTVLSRALAGTYSNLEEVISDVKAAATIVYEQVRLPNGAARTQYTPIPIETSEVASKVLAFGEKAERLLVIEESLNTSKSPENVEKSSDDSKILSNGSIKKTPSQGIADVEDKRVVLTLYGNAPQAKQLFSSLQEPVKTQDGKQEVIQPLREAGLPYGISTTRILAIPSGNPVDDKKRAPTIGDLFSTPSSTVQFVPPKPSRAANTRSLVVGWYHPSAIDAARAQSSQSYYAQNVKAGQWLDYSAFPVSMDAKRRQRERALSLSGVKVSASIADTAEHEAAKLDALFRSAYSGFAPSRDDSAAVIPEGMVNRVWWRKVGEKSFERLIRNAANVEEIITPDVNTTTNEEGVITINDKDMEELEQAVENWDEQFIDPNLDDSSDESKAINDKEVEEILQGISELLETLNSYQRIRNLSLNPISRPAMGSSIPESAGKPAKPSEAETATYNTLKAQLSLMIAMLPPYAIAKLNSDQLSELNISTKIPIIIESQKGVMEEDEVAARAKVAEMRAATSSRPAATPVSGHRSTSALYGNQYASSPRPSHSSGQQYYGQSQTPIRPPATLQRPSSTTSLPYSGVRTPANTNYQSQAGYTAPTYAHQLPRTSQSQYGQSPSQQYYRTASNQNYGQTQGQYTNIMSGTRGFQLNQTAYQQNQARPQGLQNGMDYRYNNGNVARQSSPQKQQAFSPQPQNSQLQNRSYGTPTPSLSQGRQYFPTQALTNGAGSISPQPLTQQGQQGTQGHLGATGYHTVMTAEQQASMMERQRAQLAQQQGTQHQARNAAQAGAMSASPVSQVNGGGLAAGH